MLQTRINATLQFLFFLFYGFIGIVQCNSHAIPPLINLALCLYLGQILNFFFLRQAWGAEVMEFFSTFTSVVCPKKF